MKIRDGWHNICGYSVYVDGGYILRGTKAEGTLPAWVYRWNRQMGCWVREEKISVDAFRAGVKRETIDLM